MFFNVLLVNLRVVRFLTLSFFSLFLCVGFFLFYSGLPSHVLYKAVLPSPYGFQVYGKAMAVPIYYSDLRECTNLELSSSRIGNDKPAVFVFYATYPLYYKVKKTADQHRLFSCSTRAFYASIISEG